MNTDQFEAAEIKHGVLDMRGSVCRKNELIKHTQEISVQLLCSFSMKQTWEKEDKVLKTNRMTHFNAKKLFYLQAGRHAKATHLIC